MSSLCIYHIISALNQPAYSKTTSLLTILPKKLVPALTGGAADAQHAAHRRAGYRAAGAARAAAVGGRRLHASSAPRRRWSSLQQPSPPINNLGYVTRAVGTSCKDGCFAIEHAWLKPLRPLGWESEGREKEQGRWQEKERQRQKEEVKVSPR